MKHMTLGPWQRALTGSALPFGLFLLVGLMVVPVPAVVLDIGFVANIIISLAVLLIALSAARPLDFSAFPTVLLLATLLRLSLNVASTRVVLVHGHQGGSAAGHVIESFGRFLIGGDYIVGIFVFAVLMIINLVVITKGAGRVSEVSARFTLDALPGKQMAIDADLNAGLITPDDARARRQDVATEADFYGSMDGASKFVKGDAVAGLLILFVNIFGGLLLGTLSHGLSIKDAAAAYLLLAIGDALVAQVPALLLSIAAATIVTRVTSPLDLSGQIGSQFSNSRAWGPITAIITLLGLLPGMPHLILFAAGGISGGLWLHIRKTQAPDAAPSAVAMPQAAEREIGWHDVREIAPITLDIGYGLITLVDDQKGAPLMTRITGIRHQLSKEFGFIVPMVRIKDDLSLSGNAYRIQIAGVTMGEDEALARQLLALSSGDEIETVQGLRVKDPSFGLDAFWIEPELRADAIVAGYTVVDASTVIATHLNNIILSTASEVFGLDDAQNLLDALKEHFPHLVQALTPQPYSLATITSVCRSLLLERVPLRDFRRIAEVMIESAHDPMDQVTLVETIRQRLGPLIIQGLVPLRMPLPIITFDPALEGLLLQAVQASPAALWPFDPALAKRIIQAVSAAVEDPMRAAHCFAIVTAPLCRAPLARLLRSQLPDAPVLSFLEIPESKTVDVIAVVGATDQASLPSYDVPINQDPFFQERHNDEYSD
jgi:flagellar biosynthesis protein FlhA